MTGFVQETIGEPSSLYFRCMLTFCFNNLECMFEMVRITHKLTIQVDIISNINHCPIMSNTQQQLNTRVHVSPCSMT